MSSAISIKILGDARSFKKATGAATGALSGLGGAVKAAAGAFAGLQIASFGKDAIGAASDIEESISKSNVVFGQSSTAMQNWADGAATAFGQSKGDALEAAGTFGNFFRTIGVGQKDAAGMSQNMVELASDLASFNNADPSEVVTALGAALRGEAEPMSRFGVLMNDSTLKAEALAQGLIKTTKDALTPQQKALAAQGLIFKQTKTAQGDFARTSDGLANKQRILGAQFEDVKGKIGKALLPIMLKLSTFLVEKLTPAFESVSRFVKQHWPRIKEIIVSTMSAIWDRVSAIIGRLRDLWSRHGEQIKSTVSDLFGRIRDIVLRGLAIVREFWSDHGEQIKSTVSDLFAKAKTIIEGAITTIKNVVSTVLEFVAKVWREHGDKIKSYIAKIVETMQVIWQAISDVLDKVVGIITRVFGWISSFWDRWGAGIMNVVSAIFGAIIGVIESALGIVQGIIKFVVGLITGDWGAAWDGIKNTLSGVWDTIVSLVSGSLDILKNVFRAPLRWISERVTDARDAIVRIFKGLKSKLTTALKFVGNTITAPFRLAFNTLAKLWNNTIGKFSFKVPSWVPGIGGKGFDMPNMPTIEAFHQGGVFNAPAGRSEGLALLRDGERVFTPGARNMSGGGQVVNVVVNVSGSVLTEKQLMKTIRDALIRDGRRGYAVA